MATHLRTELVLDALDMALWQRRPEAVIHHSDQGTQYTSIAFGLRCKQAGVRPSMGSVGDAYDNAMCESFFATLECELLEQCRFRTQAEARLAVFGFIEGWYNPRRRHSALGYQSPVNFERRAAHLAASPAESGSADCVYGHISGDRARPSALLPRSAGGSFPLPGDRESLNTSSLTRPRNRGRSSPCRYNAGSSAPTSFVRRANSGSTRLSNLSSRSRTRGRRTTTVPMLVASWRGFPVPVALPHLRVHPSPPLRLPTPQKLRHLLLQHRLNQLLDPRTNSSSSPHPTVDSTPASRVSLLMRRRAFPPGANPGSVS